MSLVKIDENGKGGFACSKSIDLEIGCKNSCVGCYGSKTTYMSEGYFTNIKAKEYDEKKFRASCRLTYNKGFRHIRFSKHSDSSSSHLLENFKSVLKITGEEGLRLVVVSKSLTYDEEVNQLLKDGNHTLHISLGMITKAPSDMDRKRVWMRYNGPMDIHSVNACLRLVADVTKPCEEHVGRFHSYMADPKAPNFGGTFHDKYIITPMRYASKAIAEQYGTDLSKYKYENGYYRPQEVHESWDVFKNWCGEVGGEVKCCKCLVKEDRYELSKAQA